MKSHALYKTVDNRKTLEQQNALIAKRLDESLAARIKSLQEEKAKLQEQLQIAQACEYFDLYLDIASPMI